MDKFLKNSLYKWNYIRKNKLSFLEKPILVIRRICEKNLLLLGMLYSFIIFLLVYKFAYPSWESADDFLISGILSGMSGESSPYVLVISYPLSYILYYLQIWVPQLNWLTILEIFSVWISFSVFIWFFLRKKNIFGYMVAIFMPLVFEVSFYMSLNYTRSACLLCFTGAFLIYYCFVENKCKSGVVMGILIYILGSLTRYSCSLLALPYVGIWMIQYFGRQLRKRQFLIKEDLILIVLFVIAIGVAGGGHAYHTYKYSELETNSDYMEYNSARASAYDYLVGDYWAYYDFFEKIGVSYNDYDMLRGSMIYDDFFSIDKYRQIAKINFQENETLMQKRAAVQSRLMNNLMYYNSGVQSGQRNISILFFLCAIISLICIGKKSVFSFICTICGTMLIVFYFIWTGRFPSWVQDSLYFIGSINLLYGIQWNALWVDNVHCRPNVQVIRKRMLYVICLCALVWGMSFSKTKFLNRSSIEPNVDVCRALEYMQNDTAGVYLIDNFAYCPFPIMDAYGSLWGLKKGSWDNIMRVGGWFIDHPVMNDQLERLNIKSPIREMVDDNIYLFTDLNSWNLYKYQIFFYEHYGMLVYPELVEQWGQYAIYSFKLMEQ